MEGQGLSQVGRVISDGWRGLFWEVRNHCVGVVLTL